MEKIKSFLENPYYRALLWLVLGVIIFLVGITRPKADSFDASEITGQLYDNSNGHLTAVTTTFDSGMGVWYGYITHVANSSGGAWGISSPISMLNNHTYSVSAYITVPGCGYTRLSSVDRIGSGISLANAVSSYQNNTNVQLLVSRVISNSIVQYSFKLTGSHGGYVVIPYATTSSCSNIASHLSGFVIDDLGEGSVSEQTINNSLNNQTNIINNSIANAENNINNEINRTASETQDTIKDMQKSNEELLGNCYSNLWGLGNLNGDRNLNVPLTDSLEPGTYTISYNVTNSNNSTTLLTFRNSSSVLANIYMSPGFGSYTFTINSTATAVRFYQGEVYNDTYSTSISNVMLVKGSSSKPYDDYGVNHCTSKLDDTNQAINDVNDTLNDDNVDGNSASSFFEDFTITDNGGISSIITAPLVAINAMLSNQCSPLSGTWRGQSFELPCGTDFWNRMSTIRTWLNVAIGGLLCYRIIIKLFKLIEGFKNPDNDKVEVMNL